MSEEEALVKHIFVILEPQVQAYVEVRNPQNTVQLLEVLAKLSNVDDNRRNWRNSEVLRRTSHGRNDYRGNYENGHQDKPGLTHVFYHEIDTGDNPPVVFRPYRYDRVKQAILDCHEDKMFKEGTIIPIQSSWRGHREERDWELNETERGDQDGGAIGHGRMSGILGEAQKTRAVDEWAKFYEPSVLADKLDGYKNVRSSVKKTSQPEMSLSNTSVSRSNIKKEHAIIKNDFQSKRYKLPFKQEPKQPTFKPSCYSCGRVGHTSRVCHAKNHKKTSPNRQINAVETNERLQEQSSAILTAKVAIPVYSPTKEDEKIDELQFVHIKCGNEILKAVTNTGVQISMVRADVVEGQSVDSGGTIQIMSAFGEREVTELKIFNLKIDDSRHGVVPIMCAVSKRLVNDMLVCSSAYEALLENARVQFIHNPANSYVSSRAVEGITADDSKSISSQEITQAIEKVLVSKGEQIQTRSTDQYAVAQSVVVEKEKEEISVDVIKDKDESNPVILSKERIDFDEDEIEEEKPKLPKRQKWNRKTCVETDGFYQARCGTVNIRRSSRENRSSRKRVRLKLRPQDNIYRDGMVRGETRHLDFKIVDPSWMKQGVARKLRESEIEFQKRCFKRRAKPKVTIRGDKASPRLYWDRGKRSSRHNHNVSL
ncbi:retrovirus-related Pol polyprotein from transposon opus [Trichonephila clavipes]|nr:retrovirus-related Pol polyprotein from transposon opus [Trichonephila clavipes]